MAQEKPRILMRTASVMCLAFMTHSALGVNEDEARASTGICKRAFQYLLGSNPTSPANRRQSHVPLNWYTPASMAPDRGALGAWVKSHKGKFEEILSRFLAAQLLESYVPHQRFVSALKNTIERTTGGINGPILVVHFAKNDSMYWSFKLLQKHGLLQNAIPLDLTNLYQVYVRAHALKMLTENGDTPIVIIDDGIFDAVRIKEIFKILADLGVNPKLVRIAAPFVTARAIQEIRSHRATLFFEKKAQTIGEILASIKDEGIRSNILSIAQSQYAIPLDATMTYFDHRTPDPISFYRPGEVFNPNSIHNLSERIYIPIVPEVWEPYKMFPPPLQNP